MDSLLHIFDETQLVFAPKKSVTQKLRNERKRASATLGSFFVVHLASQKKYYTRRMDQRLLARPWHVVHCAWQSRPRSENLGEA